MLKEIIEKSKRIVIKIGTSNIIQLNNVGKLSASVHDFLHNLNNDIIKLNKEVIIVSSGAIGLGGLLLDRKPSNMIEKQMLASIGQTFLMGLYEEIFKGNKVAQILLTKNDLKNKNSQKNIKNVVNTLIENNIIPIINENDAVSTDEIKFGDNDYLSALVARHCGADLLIMLTDVDGFMKNGLVVPHVKRLTPSLKKYANKSVSDVGTGGMITKLKAAGIMLNNNKSAIITNGKKENPISRLLDNDEGTLFKK